MLAALSAQRVASGHVCSHAHMRGSAWFRSLLLVSIHRYVVVIENTSQLKPLVCVVLLRPVYAVSFSGAPPESVKLVLAEDWGSGGLASATHKGRIKACIPWLVDCLKVSTLAEVPACAVLHHGSSVLSGRAFQLTAIRGVPG